MPPQPSAKAAAELALVLDCVQRVTSGTTTVAPEVAAVGTLSARAPADDWQTLLDEGVRAVGLQGARASHSAREVVALAEPTTPLVTCLPRDDGGARFVVVHGRGRHRSVSATVIEQGRARPLRLSAGELAALLDQPTPRSPLAWLVVEPSLPFESLARRGPQTHGEHGSPTTTALRRLRQALTLEREALAAMAIYAAAVGLLTLAAPLTVQALVNTIALGSLMQPLFVLIVLLLVGLSLAGGLRLLESYVVELVQRRVFVRAALDLAHRLPRVQAAAYERYDGPELVNRFFDVVTVQKAAATLLLDGLELALATLIGLLLLAFYHPLLLAFAALLVTAIAVCLPLAGRGALRTALAESNAKYDVAAWIEELARVPTLFRARRAAQAAARRADALACGWLAARQDHFRCVLRQVLVLLVLQVLASALLLGLGGALVIKGQLTLGQLVAAELIVSAVLLSLAKFGKHLETFYDLTAAIEKLGKLIDLPLEAAHGTRPLALAAARPAALALQQVSWHSVGSAGPSQRLDLNIAAGARIGLSGPTGSGKSVLLDLMFGLRTPSAGRVLVDDVDLASVDLPTLRDGFALARSTRVLSGTVQQNVDLQRAGVAAEAVRRALEQVGLQSLVAALPAGAATALTPETGLLSSEARVRLALARAICAQPRLLLIDGLLDRLAPESRAALIDALLDPRAPWTLVIASQVAEVLARCDTVYRIGPEGLRATRVG